MKTNIIMLLGSIAITFFCVLGIFTFIYYAPLQNRDWPIGYHEFSVVRVERIKSETQSAPEKWTSNDKFLTTIKWHDERAWEYREATVEGNFGKTGCGYLGKFRIHAGAPEIDHVYELVGVGAFRRITDTTIYGGF